MKKAYIILGMSALMVSGVLIGCGANQEAKQSSALTHMQEHASMAHASTDEAGTKAETKPYPLQVCVVSGEELGTMGEPTVLVHEGQKIKFCCNDCVDKFKADPEKYLAKLSEGHETGMGNDGAMHEGHQHSH